MRNNQLCAAIDGAKMLSYITSAQLGPKSNWRGPMELVDIQALKIDETATMITGQKKVGRERKERKEKKEERENKWKENSKKLSMR